MAFVLEEALRVLERTPAVLDAQLRGVGPGWHEADEGPETWTPRQVVGHLVDAEAVNWLPRARVIRGGEGGGAFAPFDRFAHLERFGERPLEELLDRFAAARAASLDELRGWRLGERELALRGRHPELGEVTLAELLSTWTVHDLAHTAQVVRVMARRYAAEVGPWRDYLSILRR